MNYTRKLNLALIRTLISLGLTCTRLITRIYAKMQWPSEQHKWAMERELLAYMDNQSALVTESTRYSRILSIGGVFNARNQLSALTLGSVTVVAETTSKHTAT